MERDEHIDPRIAFVERTLQGRRRDAQLIARHGPDRGSLLFAQEAALLGEVVVYLDTPFSQRPQSTSAFTVFMEKKAKKVGGSFYKRVMRRGEELYSRWLDDKQQRQRNQIHDAKLSRRVFPQ